MDFNRALGSVISRISDQRFLFALGGIIIVAVLTPFNLIVSMAVLASAVFILVFVVIVDRVVPAHSDESGVGMVIALDFHGTPDDADIRLAQAHCKVMNVSTLENASIYNLTAYRGGGGEGWLCPLPPGSGPNDVLEFTFLNVHGSRWVSDPIIPALLWPKVEVRRQT